MAAARASPLQLPLLPPLLLAPPPTLLLLLLLLLLPLAATAQQLSCASNRSAACPLPPWPATYALSQSSVVS